MSGTLYLCATPIGNLEDITLRVLRLLREVDIIAAEDTRHTRKLLNHFEITTPLTSYHEHNSRVKGSRLINLLQSGKNIALVTDAGMPAISDPGTDIVRLCHARNIPVTCAPGASAQSAALAISGLSSDSFSFEGFLPRETKPRRERILELTNERRTCIFYEAPHRLQEAVADLAAHLHPERNVAVISELTKLHEKTIIGPISEVAARIAELVPRGEFVIVVEGVAESKILAQERAEFDNMTIAEHVEAYVATGLDTKEAMKAVARDRGIGKSTVYKKLLDDKPK